MKQNVAFQWGWCVSRVWHSISMAPYYRAAGYYCILHYCNFDWNPIQVMNYTTILQGRISDIEIVLFSFIPRVSGYKQCGNSSDNSKPQVKTLGHTRFVKTHDPGAITKLLRHCQSSKSATHFKDVWNSSRNIRRNYVIIVSTQNVILIQILPNQLKICF